MNPSASRLAIARALSVLGHPALVMPSAVVWVAHVRSAAPGVLAMAAMASVSVAVCVGVYSVLQVRAGRWRHVDASVPRERQQLNRFLVLLLFGMASVLSGLGQATPVGLGLALGGALVGSGLLLQRWLKLSLHVGFAVFAAVLLWPETVAVAGLLALSAGVAWSRRVLGRHGRADLLAGGLVGVAAGILFHLWA